jgi:hypothetical protein
MNRYPSLEEENSPLNTPETGLSISMNYKADGDGRDKEGSSSPTGLERLGALNISDEATDRPYASKRGSKSRFAFDLEPPMEVSIHASKHWYTADTSCRSAHQQARSPINRHVGLKH